MICSIAIQSFSVVALRNAIDWSVLSRFLLGGIVGLPLGVCLLLHLDVAVYSLGLGGFLIAYGAYMLIRPVANVRWRSAWIDVMAGFLGGITRGGVRGLGGPFAHFWGGQGGNEKHARARS